jgi:hypothetical protein
MKQVDTLCTQSDEWLLKEFVYCGDAELMYLDILLSETLHN